MGGSPQPGVENSGTVTETEGAVVTDTLFTEGQAGTVISSILQTLCIHYIWPTHI